MVYQTLDQVNTSAGIHTVFLYVNSLSGGWFVPFLLISFFLVVCLGSFFAQKRASGNASFPGSFVIAGIFTTIISVILGMIPGLVPLGLIVGFVVLTALGIVWLFSS